MYFHPDKPPIHQPHHFCGIKLRMAWQHNKTRMTLAFRVAGLGPEAKAFIHISHLSCVTKKVCFPTNYQALAFGNKISGVPTFIYIYNIHHLYEVRN